MDPLSQRFVASFRKGLELEKAALRSDSTAYEVVVDRPAALEENQYACTVPRPSERLTAGVQCSLREPSGREVPVTLVRWDGHQLSFKTEAPLVAEDGPWKLVFVPWFLYDEMDRALDEVAYPESCLRAFGKLPSTRTEREPVTLDRPLNESQREAVQLGVESELAVLWGPPGTGKTTTLAQLVANLVRLERRVLITSTTHAALDQVLEQLRRTSALEPLFKSHEVVLLSELHETVRCRQEKEHAVLLRSQTRLDLARARALTLAPVLARAREAADAARQLDLFADPPAALRAAELAPVLGWARAEKLTSPDEQLAMLARLAARLKALEEGWRRRAREARAVLAGGQQEAVEAARILLTTLANSYVSPLLKGQAFDSVIVEEAGMALLPAVYLAAGRARGQVILVGDPRQLPSILTSRDAYAHQALGRNIFDVLGDRPERRMLDVQYRMHPQIGELVSRLFYAGGLRHEARDAERIAALAPFPGEAVVVVDVPGEARTDPGDYSRYNPASAAKAAELAAAAAAQGLTVAVIAPYRKQVARLQKLVNDERIDCATVHRFQGHERDVVILDVTDAPPLEPGVLLAGRGPTAASANLLNVSLSRARGKLILVADVRYIHTRAAGTVLHRVFEAAAGLRSAGVE